MSMVRPFINARWNSIMFPPESLETTTNVAVQQIYNEYKWSWKVLDETVDTFVSNGNNYIATLANQCQYALWLESEENDIVTEYYPELSVTQLDDYKYLIQWDKLTVTTEKTYTFTYIKDYEFLPYASDGSLEIPIPNKFIPALYYLVLSQLDLIDVQQLQWQPVNNFNKYQYEIKNLKDNDRWFESVFVWANPQ